MMSPINLSHRQRFLPFLLCLSIAGLWLNGCGKATPTPSASPDHRTAPEHAKQHLNRTYVCPMHPQVVRSEPGRCPICGMDLAEKEAEASESELTNAVTAQEARSVTVSDTVVSQLGVRTAEVRRGTLTRNVEGFGLFLRSTVQGYRPAYHGPAASANDRGASTSALLVQGQVFERQAPLLQVGQRVWVRVPGLGATDWEGKLIGLESQVNQTTHTQVFHVSVSPEVAASVPPGMNANLIVEVAPVTDVLLVPRESVIVTGRGARVMVALPGGRFEQREVEVEDFGEDEIVVRSGLREGERVVVSAQFLLDSEANLQAGLKRLSGDPRAEHSSHEGATHHEVMHQEAIEQEAIGQEVHAGSMPEADMPVGAVEREGDRTEVTHPQAAQEGATQ